MVNGKMSKTVTADRERARYNNVPKESVGRERRGKKHEEAKINESREGREPSFHLFSALQVRGGLG